MLTFTKEFYLEETRNDHTIDPITKRHWAALLEVVAEIDRVCKKYDIQYFADWGTLLGVVRHKGFIPWDDDIDLTMKREDYRRFLEIAPREFDNFEDNGKHYGSKPGQKLVYHSPHVSKKSYLYQTFVASGRAICTDEDYLKRFHGYPFIAAVDIFPLDYFPEDNEETELVLNIIELLCTIILNDVCWNERGMPSDKEVSEQLDRIEGALGYHFDKKKNIRMQALRLVDNLFSMYGRDESVYLENVGWFATDPRRTQRYRKEWFDEVVYLPFENIQLPVPAEYDKVLTAMYNDYMTLRNYGGHSDEQVSILLKGYDFGGRDYREVLNEIFEQYD